MLAGGGRTLEDLSVLRNDEGLRALVQLGDMPSSDATGDWLRRMRLAFSLPVPGEEFLQPVVLRTDHRRVLKLLRNRRLPLKSYPSGLFKP